MKFAITKTSDWRYADELEINSIKQLIKFINDNGGQVVIITNNNISDKTFPEIEIYDDYRE